MRLSDLSPRLLKIVDEGHYQAVDSFDDADGIFFQCPKCVEDTGHGIICWRPQVPQSPRLSGPGRWEFQGTSFEDLSLKAGSSSILLTGLCEAHFFVENGEIRFC